MIPFEQISLRTERLLLRPIQLDDEQAMFALRSNPAVTRYTDTPTWQHRSEAAERVERDIRATQSGQYLKLGLHRRDSPGMIGTCLLYEFNQQCRRADVGYDLHPEMWGKGYMHEALTALLDFGFTSLDLNRVEADVDPNNLQSARALLRLGFVQEGFLRERWISNGVKSDTALFGLLLSDWQSDRVDAATA